MTRQRLVAIRLQMLHIRLQMVKLASTAKGR